VERDPQARGGAVAHAGAVSGGGLGAPRRGGADGGPQRADGGRPDFAGPGFADPVPTDGYVWWYVDAVSDDGRYALTLIAFQGSVFSPRYHTARRRGAADPLDHCAINLHIAGPDGELWVFTEIDRSGVARSDTEFALSGPHGSARLERRGGALFIEFDARTKPFFQRMPPRVKGRIRLTPTARFDHPVSIDGDGRHTWWALAPHARVEVELDAPDIRFSGPAYHDCNRGLEGLEDGFASWTWSRVELPHGTAVLYDVLDRKGRARELGWVFGDEGTIEPIAPPERRILKPAGWGIDRATRVDPGGDAKVVQTLVASPFYARSIIETTVGGHRATGIHEALDCDRFAAGWVRFLLPWRIRSAPRGGRRVRHVD